MKYGVIFSIVSLLLLLTAIQNSGWYLLLLWPALSVGVVGVGYLWIGERVYGKLPDGRRSMTCQLILLPFWLYLSTAWHGLRLLVREPAVDELVDGIFIGRRLLSHEIPHGMVTVVDLTSEFTEPQGVRAVENYVALPMLDGSVLPAHQLLEAVTEIAVCDRPLFIHCAQGHGRTGLVAALLLIVTGEASNAESALAIVTQARPKVRLNTVQRRVLEDSVSLFQEGKNSA